MAKQELQGYTTITQVKSALDNVATIDQKVGNKSQEISIEYGDLMLGIVFSTSGSTWDSGVTDYKRSKDYIDISQYKGSSLNFSNFSTNLSNAVTRGLAFYDSSKAYISGVSFCAGDSRAEIIDTTVIIPANAAYIRFTMIVGCESELYIKVITKSTGVFSDVDTNKKNIDLLGVNLEKFKTSFGATTTSKASLSKDEKKIFSSGLSVGDTVTTVSNNFACVGSFDLTDYNDSIIYASSLKDQSPSVVLADDNNKVIALLDKTTAYYSQPQSCHAMVVDLSQYENVKTAYFLGKDASTVPVVYLKNKAKGVKEKMPITIVAEGITQSKSMYCDFTESYSKKVAGSGSKTITLRSQSPIVGRSVSFGLLLPWVSQDVASFKVKGETITTDAGSERLNTTISKATDTSVTSSGKTYYVQGDDFSRITLTSIQGETDITIEVVANDGDSWHLYVTDNVIIEDGYDKTPICIVFDGAAWNSTTDVDGETLDQFQMMDKLNIPYGICCNTSAYQSISDTALSSVNRGLAEVTLRCADAMSMFASSADNIIVDKIHELSGEIDAFSEKVMVLGQHIYDKKVLRCLRKSGAKVVRGNSYSFQHGIVSNMGTDAETIVLPAEYLGQHESFFPTKLPMLFWAHGVGGTVDSMHCDGAKTLALLKYIKDLEDKGEAVILPPSKFAEYL